MSAFKPQFMHHSMEKLGISFISLNIGIFDHKRLTLIKPFHGEIFLPHTALLCYSTVFWHGGLLLLQHGLVRPIFASQSEEIGASH